MTAPPPRLIWHFDPGFIAYVRGLPDGEVTAFEPAAIDGATLSFPRDGDSTSLQYEGSVRFAGYGGMLSIAIDAPAVSDGGNHLVLTSRSAAGTMRIVNLVEAAGRIYVARLRPEAMALFGGAYEPGKVLGRVVIPDTSA